MSSNAPFAAFCAPFGAAAARMPMITIITITTRKRGAIG